LLSRIANAMPAIPYGFNAQGVVFDPATGDLLSRPEIGKGLTCATFITAILQVYRYSLADLSTWPDRDQDREWEQDIIRFLTQFGASQEHIAAIRNDVGAKRLRPCEVVAAGFTPSDLWPLRFEAVAPIAQQVIDELG
jgi:hypothetical protein